MSISLVPTDAHEEIPEGVSPPEGGLDLDAVQERMRGAARLWFVVENGEAVGLACYFDDGERPEIGYGVSLACRGRGLAKQITAALQDLARSSGRAGLTAHTAEANRVSGKVLARAGFTRTDSRDDPGMGIVHFWRWDN